MSRIDRNTVTTTRQLPANSQTTTTVEIDSTTTYTRHADLADYISVTIVVFIIVIGIFGFIKSVASRKYYKCTQCGESFRSENMQPKTCKVCGADLEETNDKKVNDTTK